MKSKNHFEKLKELYYFEQQLLMNDPGDDDWIDDHQTIGDESDNEIYYGKDFKKSGIKEEQLFFVH